MENVGKRKKNSGTREKIILHSNYKNNNNNKKVKNTDRNRKGIKVR